MKITSFNKLGLAALTLSAVAGCGGGGGGGGTTVASSGTVTPSMVALQFIGEVGGQPFTCGNTYTGVGSGLHDYQVTDFRFHVYEAHIHDGGQQYDIELTQDGTWQLDHLALIDLEDGCGAGTPEMNDMLIGEVTVPATVDMQNTEVCFSLGVPFDMNHIDEATAASPLNASGMLWAWRNGRKFIRIDGIGDPSNNSGSGPNPFNLHLGSQACSNAVNDPTQPPDTACTYPNTVEICLDNFDTTNDVIRVDPAAVLAASDITMAGGGPPGCQSFANDDDCIEVMPRLGLGAEYAAYGNASSTSGYNGPQLLFSK